MDHSFLVYLNILALGIPLLFIITQLKIFHDWFNSLISNRLIFFCIASIFLLLFWPADPGAAFKVNESLGVVRLIRIVFLVGMAFILIFYLVRYPTYPRNTVLSLYGGYTLVCLTSALYSPNWVETVWKSFELIVLLQLVLVTRKEILAERFNQLQLIQGCSYLVFAAVFLALVGGMLYPEQAYNIQDEFREIGKLSMGGIVPRINPNTLGQFSAMVAFAGFLFMVIQGRFRVEPILLLLVGGLGMVFAHARTSIFAFALLVVIFSALKGGLRGFIAITFISIVGLFSFDYLFEFIVRGQETDLFLSMSGRSYMWGIAWDSILNDPWLGKGFYAGHKTLDIVLGMEYSSLDNTYIEALVDVGVIGTVFLTIFVLILLKKMIILVVNSRYSYSPDFWWINVSAGYVFIMFIRSLAGPSFQVLHFNLLLLLVISVAWELNSTKRYTALRTCSISH